MVLCHHALVKIIVVISSPEKPCSDGILIGTREGAGQIADYGEIADRCTDKRFGIDPLAGDFTSPIKQFEDIDEGQMLTEMPPQLLGLRLLETQ
jgi:hypothetical protein